MVDNIDYCSEVVFGLFYNVFNIFEVYRQELQLLQ